MYIILSFYPYVVDCIKYSNTNDCLCHDTSKIGHSFSMVRTAILICTFADYSCINNCMRVVWIIWCSLSYIWWYGDVVLIFCGFYWLWICSHEAGCTLAVLRQVVDHASSLHFLFYLLCLHVVNVLSTVLYCMWWLVCGVMIKPLSFIIRRNPGESS